jgi:hypothetical protein
VQFALANPGSVATAPNFVVQVDNQDPVTTTSTSVDFTGLAPGPHTVTVQLVDANNTPIAGARAIVQFTTVQPQAELTPKPGTIVPAALHEDVLPHTRTTLPLLSVIGFGVLVGGIVSAMKTR